MMPRYRASLLLLMGEADTQSPRSGICLEARRDQESGASIEWHVYPATTHCWDRKQLDEGQINVRGHQVEYLFQQSVTGFRAEAF